MIMSTAEMHLLVLWKARLDRIYGECPNCHAPSAPDAQYCFGCGDFIAGIRIDRHREWEEEKSRWGWIEEYTSTDDYKSIQAIKETYVFPNSGIYILYHEHEGYKIGQAEDIRKRVDTLRCAAPSLQLLHVIETLDMDWCERFLHDRFRHRRKRRSREYFQLTDQDLMWLFEVFVLEPPRSIADQLSLMELL